MIIKIIEKHAVSAGKTIVWDHQKLPFEMIKIVAGIFKIVSWLNYILGIQCVFFSSKLGRFMLYVFGLRNSKYSTERMFKGDPV